MGRWLCALATCLGLAAGAAHAGTSKGVPMLDQNNTQQGTAVVSLPKGSVSIKANMAPLPAMIDTGSVQFTATIYKAYLVSSTDPSMEIPLANVYPTTPLKGGPLGKVAVKAALKGDLSHLGLDKVVIVGFSEDGLDSFDVLTGTLVTP